jgi:L-malate glycosyltransferase
VNARRPVHQILGALHEGDAVGHEAVVMRRILQGRGHASEIFAGHVDDSLASKARPLRDLAPAAVDESAWLFHYSPGSPAGALALAGPERLGVVFHNVTPPHFLAPFDPELARRHQLGIEELRRFASRARVGLAHSEFSRRDLAASGFGARARVVPFAVDLQAAPRSPAPVLRRLLGDGRLNVLFIGRIAPNKRIEDLIRSFGALRARGDRSTRLVLVGETGGFPTYMQSLSALVDKLRLQDVVFTGRVSETEREACYASASAFVSLSEHEGFGAPLVEAMARDVPVIAFDSSAVAETLRGGGVLLGDKRPLVVAEVLHAVLHEPTLREAILRTQRKAVAEWRRVDFGACFLAVLEPLVA